MGRQNERALIRGSLPGRGIAVQQIRTGPAPRRQGLGGLSFFDDDWTGTTHDLVIAVGLILDPESGRTEPANIGIRDGRITGITPDALKGDQVLDAFGMIVACGWMQPAPVPGGSAGSPMRPAATIGQSRLMPGMIADIVVFDPVALPHVTAQGAICEVVHVIARGREVIRDGSVLPQGRPAAPHYPYR